MSDETEGLFDDLDEGGHVKPKDGKRKRIPRWVEIMAMDIALKGMSIADMARKFDKTRRTISYWKAQPEVKVLIARIKEEAYQNAMDRYQGLVGVAVEVLARYLGFDPDTGEFERPALNSEVRQVASDVVKGTGIHKARTETEHTGDLGINLDPKEEERIGKELKRFFGDRKRPEKK
jgi:hypothetical protein